jgi:2-dehydro-3-deoxyglucarate aldolase/4-hydroxy-2-oxoheptanedioate aldolase
MKPNLLRTALAEGRPAVGHMLLEFGSRGIAKIVEASGLDFVLIDMEHSGLDFGAVADLLAWFKATPVTPIVRVPSIQYHFIARVMDAGAMGVMAPNVRTAEQAREVVGAMRFAPEGFRGLGLGTAHNDYVVPPVPAYLAEANQQNVAICQIESTLALENLEAIAAAPGVDILFIGHFDLTQSMGIVGEFENPRFLEAIHRVATTANARGKVAGIQPGTVVQARQAISMGYRVISMGHDTAVYGNALRGMVDELRNG